MKIIRTVVWVVILIALLLFAYFNWKPVEVKIWEGLILETKIPALVVISFLVGLIPMWLIHRASRWQNRRRIASLENAVRNATAAAEPAPSAQATKGTDTNTETPSSFTSTDTPHQPANQQDPA
ncbi:lipopolysaccharide assembly protein LapA domain-containing protein [Altericroceibacterium spongiae]|uniref:lipopolysaccharide assembly protein LapA domain-containing protein n=1 Tax=Altericroceibacterium spongiae TaxID=2320269 RepID=UPI0016007B40|nr:lipopolysaccharide assembly protein LapA domain-containing protein [Altericroceibacterium spongiae]